MSCSKVFLVLYGPALQVSVLSYIQHTSHFATPPKSTLVPEPLDISLVWHISLKVLFSSLLPVCILTVLP